jgi:chaperonin GroES
MYNQTIATAAPVESLQPVGERVLVRREDPEKQSAGGIVLPDVAQSKATRARVIAVGPGRRTRTGVRVPPAIKTGDLVILHQWQGLEAKVGADGCEYVFVKESEIVAVEDES